MFYVLTEIKSKAVENLVSAVFLNWVFLHGGYFKALLKENVFTDPKF